MSNRDSLFTLGLRLYAFEKKAPKTAIANREIEIDLKNGGRNIDKQTIMIESTISLSIISLVLSFIEQIFYY